MEDGQNITEDQIVWGTFLNDLIVGGDLENVTAWEISSEKPLSLPDI